MRKKAIFAVLIFVFLVLSSSVYAACNVCNSCRAWENKCLTEIREYPDTGEPYTCEIGCGTDWNTVNLNVVPAEKANKIPFNRISQISTEKIKEFINYFSEEQLAYLDNNQLDAALPEMDNLNKFKEHGSDLLFNYFKSRFSFGLQLVVDEDISDDSKLTFIEDGGIVYLDNNGARFYVSEFVSSGIDYIIAYSNLFHYSEFGDMKSRDVNGFIIMIGGEEFTISGLGNIRYANPSIYGENKFLINGMIVEPLNGKTSISMQNNRVTATNAHIEFDGNEFFGDVEFGIDYYTTHETTGVDLVHIMIDKGQPINVDSGDSWACIDEKDKCMRASGNAKRVLMCLECADINQEELDSMIESGELDGYSLWDMSINAQGEFADSSRTRGEIITNLYRDGPILEGNNKDMIFEYRDDGFDDDIEFIFEGESANGAEVGLVNIYGKGVLIQNENLGGEQTLRVYEERVTEHYASNKLSMDMLFDDGNNIWSGMSEDKIVGGYSIFRDSMESCISIQSKASCKSKLKNDFGETFTLYSGIYESEHAEELLNTKQVMMHHDTYIVNEDGDELEVENLYFAQGGNLMLHQYETRGKFTQYLTNKFVTEAYEEAYELGISEMGMDLYVANKINLAKNQMFFEKKSHEFNAYIEYATEANFWPKRLIKDGLYDEETAYKELAKYNMMTEGARLIQEYQTDPNNQLTLDEIYKTHSDNEYIRAAFLDPGMTASWHSELIDKGQGKITINGIEYDLATQKAEATEANMLSAAQAYNDLGYYDVSTIYYSELIKNNYNQEISGSGKTVADVISESWDQISFVQTAGYSGPASEETLVYPTEVRELIKAGYISEELIWELASNKRDMQASAQSEAGKQFLSNMIPDTALEIGFNLAFIALPVVNGVVATKSALVAGEGITAMMSAAKTMAVIGAGFFGFDGVGSIASFGDNAVLLADDALRWADDLNPNQIESIYHIMGKSDELADLIKLGDVSLSDDILKEFLMLPESERIARASLLLDEIAEINPLLANEYAASMRASGIIPSSTGRLGSSSSNAVEVIYSSNGKVIYDPVNSIADDLVEVKITGNFDARQVQQQMGGSLEVERRLTELNWGRGLYDVDFEKAVYIALNGIEAPTTRYVYHGTSSIYIDSILDDGINNMIGTENNPMGAMGRVEGATYAADIDYASDFSFFTTNDVGGNEMILRWDFGEEVPKSKIGATDVVDSDYIEVSLDGGNTWTKLNEYGYLDYPDVPNIAVVGDEAYYNYFKTKVDDSTTQFVEFHQPTLVTTQAELNSMYSNGIVTGRLKDDYKVEEKIYRYLENRKISNRDEVFAAESALDSIMQDVVGTRVEFDSLDDVDDAVKIIEDKIESGQWNVIEMDDYIENPKNGYRSVHYIIDIDDVPIEIQLRTQTQTVWADWAHKDIYKGAFKNEPEAVEYMTRTGDWLYAYEQGKHLPMPDCPPMLAQQGLCFSLP